MMRYFKAVGDEMFIPEGKILRLFRSPKNHSWYVTMEDWTNVKVESPEAKPFWDYAVKDEHGEWQTVITAK